jgi:hypothetical protein
MELEFSEKIQLFVLNILIILFFFGWKNYFDGLEKLFILTLTQNNFSNQKNYFE